MSNMVSEPRIQAWLRLLEEAVRAYPAMLDGAAVLYYEKDIKIGERLRRVTVVERNEV